MAAFIRHCEQDSHLGEAEITMLGRLLPKSEMLLRACCRTLTESPKQPTNIYERHFGRIEHAQASAAAARNLATYFSGNDVAWRRC